MPGKLDRPLLQVRLTPEAKAGVAALAQRYGLTMTAMLEAIGHNHRTVTLPASIVTKARAIDAERHSR